MNGKVVVLDASGTLPDLVRPELEEAGYHVAGARSVDQAVEEVAGRAVVVFDACLPVAGGPGRLVADLRSRARVRVLQVSGCAAVDSVCRSHPHRADGFLVRPFRGVEMVAAVEALLSNGRSDVGFAGMVGASEPMLEVFSAIRLVAPTEATVLITGETGTGKEMVARALHDSSAVRDGPFVAVDCGALPESLLESELFGHVRGAFTGAVRGRRGLIETAQGGTLFLDEVASTPPRLQKRLLRVLQERQIRPVGTSHPMDVDVRVLAATSRELEREVRLGRFREDLYFRLRVFTLSLPPLRDRSGDVERIARALLRDGPGGRGAACAGISAAALDVLEAYRWPGNVRELAAFLESASIRAGGGVIEVAHLPTPVASRARASDGAGDTPSPHGTTAPPTDAAPTPADEHRPSEEKRILSALRETGGHRGQAARRLGMSRTTLWRRIRSLGIDPPDP